jgi:hypothetical protein
MRKWIQLNGVQIRTDKIIYVRKMDGYIEVGCGNSCFQEIHMDAEELHIAYLDILEMLGIV